MLLLFFSRGGSFIWTGPVSARTAIVEPEFRNFVVV